jgi:hypothetical protein
MRVTRTPSVVAGDFTGPGPSAHDIWRTGKITERVIAPGRITRAGALDRQHRQNSLTGIE